MVEERQQSGKTEVLITVGRLFLHHILIPRFKIIKGGLVRLPTIEEFMEITINNWAKYNPRHDLKSVPWVRISATIGYDRDLHGLSPGQKWLWVFCLCEAGRENKEGIFSCTTKWLIDASGCLEDEVSAGLKHLSDQGLITLTNGSVRNPNGSDLIRTDPNGSVPNGTERNVTKRNETERKKRTKKTTRCRAPLSSHDPEFSIIEGSLGDDWLAHALKEMPWKENSAGWDAATFAAQLLKVKKSSGLNDEGMRAVLDFISASDFWTKNAVSPKGLLTKGKSGLRKIDTILSQMKTPEMRRDEKLLEWANGPERNVWGELVCDK